MGPADPQASTDESSRWQLPELSYLTPFLTRCAIRLGMVNSLIVLAFFAVSASLLIRWIILWSQGTPLSEPPKINVVIATVTPLVVSVIAGFFIFRMVFELDRIKRKVHVMAITDGLTGVYNRRAFMLIAEAECTRAQNKGTPFALVMIDVDHFKQVNDLHGHSAGDLVLQQIVERCKAGLRPDDIIVRYGGEEFCVLLPNTDYTSAMDVAERMRRRVNHDQIQLESGNTLRVTASFGVVTDTLRFSLLQLLEQADQALYKAKKTGRNRVLAHGDIAESTPWGSAPAAT